MVKKNVHLGEGQSANVSANEHIHPSFHPGGNEDYLRAVDGQSAEAAENGGVGEDAAIYHDPHA